MSRFTWNSREDDHHKECTETNAYIYVHTQRTGINDSLQKAYEIHACISGNHRFSKHNNSHVLKIWESTEITVSS